MAHHKLHFHDLLPGSAYKMQQKLYGSLLKRNYKYYQTIFIYGACYNR